MKNEKGFTLVELLIVIAVVFILSMLAVISLSGLRAKTRDTDRITDINAVRDAMIAVKAGSETFENACAEFGQLSSCDSSKDEWLGAYIPNVSDMNDPIALQDNLCQEDSQSACNYNFAEVGKDNYNLYFYMERGIDRTQGEGVYKLTESGIEFVAPIR